jgi:hypothetical protein
MTSAEQHYPVHEQELLAIVYALKKWCSYLLGTHFTVLTDHQSIHHLPGQKDMSARQARWTEFLSEYDFTLRYIAGKINTVVDALSRYPYNATPEVQVAYVQAHAATTKVTLSSLFTKAVREGYQNDEFCKKL